MARLLTLAFLALLTVAEVAAVLALVDWLGAFGAMLVLALDVLVGLWVIRWAVRGPAKDRGFRLAAGAFIALPGLVLDLVGLVLLIPGVREWVRTRVMRSTESALRRSGISVVAMTTTGDVVPGVVVVDEASFGAGSAAAEGPGQGGQGPGAGERPTSGAAGQPGRPSGPPVIRGEIVSAEAVDDSGDPPTGH